MSEPKKFFNREGKEITRQVTEIYSRIVGYMSPLNRWNAGKKEEWKDRKTYKIN